MQQPATKPLDASEVLLVICDGTHGRVSLIDGQTLGVRHVMQTANRGYRVAKIGKDGTIAVTSLGWSDRTPGVSHDGAEYDIVLYDPFTATKAREGDPHRSVLAGHLGSTSCIGVVDADRDFPRLVSGNYGESPRMFVWDVQTGEILARLLKFPTSPYCALHVPNSWNNELIIGGAGRRQTELKSRVGTAVRRYDLSSGRLDPIGYLEGRHQSGMTVWDIVVDPVSQILTTVSSDRTARLWAHDKKECVGTLKLHFPACSAVYCPDLQRLFIGTSGRVEVWDFRMPRTNLTYFKVGNPYTYGMARIDDKRFVSVGPAAVWTAEGKILKKFDEKELERSQGVCTVGSPYDCVRGESEEVEDASARLEFLLELQERCFPIFGACRVGGRRILLPRWWPDCLE